MNQNIQLIKIYNFHIIFPICQVFKRNYAVFHEICTDCCTPFHSCFNSSEHPVTIEVFYFHPAISVSIPVLYIVPRQLANSYCYIWGFYTILLLSQHITAAAYMKSAVYATVPQDSCLTHKISSFTACKVHLVNAQ